MPDSFSACSTLACVRAKRMRRLGLAPITRSLTTCLTPASLAVSRNACSNSDCIGLIGLDQVGALDALQRRAERARVAEVARGGLEAEVAQVVGLGLVAHERAGLGAAGLERTQDLHPGRAGRSGHQQHQSASMSFLNSSLSSPR